MPLLKPAVYQNGVYLNPVPTEVGATRHLFQMFRKLLTGKQERVPRRQLGPFVTDPAAFARSVPDGLRITWLGHSSLLVEIDGTTLLIDPVFSRRASFSQQFGPARFFPAPLSMEQLPPLDAVLITHDHYDHLDAPAIRKMHARVPLFLCSEGVERHLQRWGIPAGKLHGMNWMDSFTVPSASPTPLTLTALPARHFSGRSLKRYTTLWSSFALKTARRSIYHGADSGYYSGFKEIGEAFGPFDLATIEIGAFDPLWADIHMGPDNAVLAAQDLRARVLMPIHWGTFNLAFHDWFQPAERLVEVAAAAGLLLWMPQPGDPATFTGEPRNSLWWRRYMRTESEQAKEPLGDKAAKVAARG